MKVPEVGVGLNLIPGQKIKVLQVKKKVEESGEKGLG